MFAILFWTAPAVADEPVEAAPVIDEAYRQFLKEWLERDGMPPEEAGVTAGNMAAWEASLPWQVGEVDVADGVATLSLTDGARFVGPEAAAHVLEQWGNPPDMEKAGLILPAGAHLLGPGSWAVLVDYDADGWVDDADAASIDYDELLTEMKATNAESSAERVRMGLDPLDLVGWAEPPRYEKDRKVLYWARDLRSNDDRVLNYEVRVLGRGGVLSLNAVADLEDLPAVRGGMEPIRSAARFTPGNTYADYQPGVDNKAAFGIAALVAGGALASKGGLLKGLIAALIAGKKFVIVGVAALLAGARTLFGGGKKGAAPPDREA